MSVTLKVCVQKPHKDGFWPVYLRITHNRKIAYVKTDYLVGKTGIDENGEIVDQFVMKQCSTICERWVKMLNCVSYSEWTVKEVVDYLMDAEADVCLSDYAREHIRKIVREGRERTAKNYKIALGSLELYMGTNKLMFSKVTSSMLNGWIQSMVNAGAKRCKEMYPVCMREVWKAAMKELNDEEFGIMRIKNNPWQKVVIPKSDEAHEQAIEPAMLRKFFGLVVPETRSRLPLMELGMDVARIAFCLAGMYAVDLYEAKAEDYHDGVLHYYRAKTRKKRSDSAYFEIKVPEMLRPLLQKYKPKRKKEYLFSFAELYSTEDSFCANANIGIRQLCQLMGIDKEHDYSIKTFRHTWATIARNCIPGTTMEDVAFALNHSSAHKVTEIYVDKDFSPAWELNEKVLRFVFCSEDPGNYGKPEKRLETDRISKLNLMRGTMYYRGRKMAEVKDTGFGNKKEIVAKLAAMMPDDVPERSIVQFVIENIDKGESWMYEHQVGKGI